MRKLHKALIAFKLGGPLAIIQYSRHKAVRLCGVRLCPQLYGFLLDRIYKRDAELRDCKHGAVVRYRGEEIRLLPPCVVEIGHRGRKILFYDPLPFLDDVLFEVLRGVYNELNVEGRDVVDIGAGIGDTAILFSLNGARRVIALEPYPYLYEKAYVNISLNRN